MYNIEIILKDSPGTLGTPGTPGSRGLQLVTLQLYPRPLLCEILRDQKHH